MYKLQSRGEGPYPEGSKQFRRVRVLQVPDGAQHRNRKSRPEGVTWVGYSGLAIALSTVIGWDLWWIHLLITEW